MADLVALALRGDQLPKQRGNRAHLLVTITEDNLRTGRGFGVTASGGDPATMDGPHRHTPTQPPLATTARGPASRVRVKPHHEPRHHGRPVPLGRRWVQRRPA
jgi:hypothetical protein